VQELIVAIQDQLKDAKTDLEEIYAFGKSRAERGAARFKTEEGMRKYMTSKTDHVFEFMGKNIYTNAGGVKAAADRKREKAVRKLVRALIEKEGGDSAAVKAEIETNYK
jgi:hypothetical protein